MAIVSNSTSNSTYEKMSLLPASQCIPWLVVAITECLAVVILNIITIIVFVKQRQLQRRSTYLIIHLAIVDLLVGAVSQPLNLAEKMATFCDLWENPFDNRSLDLTSSAFVLLFYFISIVNLAVISLERLHATFCPLKHRHLRKWVYVTIICVMWAFSTLVESAPFVIHGSPTAMSLYYDILSSLCLIVLLVICTSYILIFIKVRCGPHLQHHGAVNRERKLTTTLLVVTLVSLLTWLPGVIFFIVNDVISDFKSYWELSKFHISFALNVLTVANSLVNPILYAIRMPQFRTVVSRLFRKTPNHRETHGIQLKPIN